VQKILYAIQQKAAEEGITSRLEPHSIVPSGAAAYREAVIPSLKESSADILVYRESLKGSLDHFQLMLDIRREFPHVRVVFLANSQSFTSPLLCKLVFLGIYDIIVKDNPTLSDIVDYILNPRDFSYANKFFHPEMMEDLIPKPVEKPQVEDTGKPKKGFLSIIDRFANPLASAEPSQPTVVNTQTSSPRPQADIPKMDMETMRSAMLEEARRTAQAEIPLLVDSQVKVATASLTQDLEQSRSEAMALTQQVNQAKAEAEVLKRQLTDAIQLRKSAEERLSDIQKEADLASQHYQAQLTSLQVTKPPEWYQEQTNKWLAERAGYQSKLTALTETVASLNNSILELKAENQKLTGEITVKSQQIESLQLSVPRPVSVDDALDVDYVDIPDVQSEYRVSPTGEGRLIAFMGTKHGVGNTTVALNTAIALANCGYKTCFIEINRHFPMVNEFFEFNNIVRGLDTALKALQENNPRLAMQCVIKPHGISATSKQAEKVYKRLPGPLHFLLFSNAFLLQCKTGNPHPITERELKDLAYFLTVQEHYSYVVIDLQPDDQDAISVFLGSGHVHQLVLTLTQDPHSISTAGYMITALARSRGSSLIKNAQFALNQYSSQNKMQPNRICNFLHIASNRLTHLTLDSKGYMDATYSMVPYTLSKGKFSNEYVDLRMKITK